MAEKRWYRYTDESGNCWRVKTSEELAEVGGLEPIDAGECAPVSERISPRYVWLAEWPRPADRLRAPVKVVLERGRLKEVWSRGLSWEITGKSRGLEYFGSARP